MNPSTNKLRWFCLGLAVFTLALYAPALRCQFIALDDPAYVTENRHVQAGLTLGSVAWAFRATVVDNWHPLAMLSHMLDCQIYGMRPWGHHLTNVLLHAANGVLLFLVLTRMTGAVGRSACVAALFAVHPARVESVAWVTERKDVLSAFFWLLAIGAYVRYVEELKKASPNARRFYGLSLALFVLALLSKAMVVTLPFVLLLLDFWPLRRLSAWGLARLAAPGGGEMALAGVERALVRHHHAGLGGSADSLAALPVLDRLNHAMIAYINYLRLLIFPWHLSVYYPYRFHQPLIWGAAAGLALGVLTGLALAVTR